MTDHLTDALRALPAHQAPDLVRASSAAAAALPGTVAYATTDSPLGALLLARSERGLARVGFAAQDGEDALLDDLARRLTPRLVRAPSRLDAARRALEDYFAGTTTTFALELDLTLVTPFTRAVLDACSRIPFGATSTYAEVAAAAGSPRGTRAAGNALGANPVPVVVPCHRVLRSGGALGGYAGGTERKQVLLALESGAG